MITKVLIGIVWLYLCVAATTQQSVHYNNCGRCTNTMHAYQLLTQSHRMFILPCFIGDSNTIFSVEDFSVTPLPPLIGKDVTLTADINSGTCMSFNLLQVMV